MQANEFRIFKKVCYKYSILKFRMKLSYIAFQKGITILELWLNAILTSYKTLTKTGAIPPYNDRKKAEKYLFKQITRNTKGSLKLIVLENMFRMGRLNDLNDNPETFFE